MKVAFISRSTLFTNPGGDTVQLTATAKYLRRLGVEVDAKLTTEEIEHDQYELLHFFNITRPADILYHLQKASCPSVVSTIFVEYEEADRLSRKGMKGAVLKNVSPELAEYIKTWGRLILSGENIRSRSFLWKGQKGSIQTIIREAACLLPNSTSEYDRLKSRYGAGKCHKIIPNGIDTEIFNKQESNSINRDRNTIVCVARVEPIKNQLNLVKALRNSKFELLLIGDPSSHHKAYYEACKKLATGNIHFIGRIAQTELIPFYASAKVHVLPSWFETTGLSSLESAAMGCNIVITNRGDAAEYFADLAYYCEPDQPESIFKAIEQAANAESNPGLQQRIFAEFTWEQAALKTLAAYKEVLKL